MSFWRMGRYAASAALWAVWGCVAVAQEPPAVKAFRPAGPLPSYEVATVKLVDNPDKPPYGMTLRRYIADAFEVPLPIGLPGVEMQGSQVIGGPEWIDHDRYDIRGKASDEIRDAMQKMTGEQRRQQDEMLRQSLLAERFHLKVHFETREMQVFELVPAKGGLKIKAQDESQGAEAGDSSRVRRLTRGDMHLSIGNNGLNTIVARGATLEMLASAIRGQAPEIAGSPIVNNTGFTDKFDLEGFRFLGRAYTGGPQGAATASDPDAPSLSEALDDQLGIRLVRARAPVEVVVIDSIDRPTEN